MLNKSHRASYALLSSIQAVVHRTVNILFIKGVVTFNGDGIAKFNKDTQPYNIIKYKLVIHYYNTSIALLKYWNTERMRNRMIRTSIVNKTNNKYYYKYPEKQKGYSIMKTHLPDDAYLPVNDVLKEIAERKLKGNRGDTIHPIGLPEGSFDSEEYKNKFYIGGLNIDYDGGEIDEKVVLDKVGVIDYDGGEIDEKVVLVEKEGRGQTKPMVWFPDLGVNTLGVSE